MEIAIIGSGISGLSSAVLLSGEHKITLIENDDRFGGHANTIDVKINKDNVPVDTGFIVYNKVNYPRARIIRLCNLCAVSSLFFFKMKPPNSQNLLCI